MTNSPDTKYKLESKNEEYCLLSYENKNIKVSTALIPFWSKEGEELYYDDGKFNRILSW